MTGSTVDSAAGSAVGSAAGGANTNTTGLDDGRGVLYPRRLPTFHREPAPTGLEDLIRWL